MAKFCAKCGNALNDEQRFCPKCGTPVAVPPARPVAAPTPIVPTPVQPVAPVQPTPVAPAPVQPVAAPAPAPTPAPVAVPAQAIEILDEDKQLRFLEGIPLVLEDTALIADHGQDKVFARCIFRSLSDQPIKALLAEFTCLDVWGKALGEPVEHQYLDLRLGMNTKFGQTNPVELPDKNTRKFQVSVKKVLYADGTMVDVSGKVAATMAAPVLLSNHLGSQDLVTQFTKDTTPKAMFAPEFGGSYWRCTCGALNVASEAGCHSCGCTQEKLTAAMDLDVLREHLEARLTEERRIQIAQAERIRQAEEAARLEQERKQKEIQAFEEVRAKQKKKKRNILIAISAVVLLVAVVLGVIFIGLPASRYEEAYQLFEQGYYMEAYDAFIALGDYEDSEQMALECKYQQAKALMKKKDYANAIKMFTDLGSYSDSATQIKECKYQQALQKLNSKDYSGAISAFSALGSYSDSATMVKECKYQYVLANKNNDDTTTYSYLKDLKSAGYKDASTIYSNLYSWKITVLGWNSSSTEGNYKTTISRYNSVYCHIKLTGGTPGETLTIKVTGSLPNGNSINYTFNSAWSDGSTGWYGWADGLYTYPQYGSTGYIYVYFYDAAGNKIGSSSVYIGS